MNDAPYLFRIVLVTALVTCIAWNSDGLFTKIDMNTRGYRVQLLSSHDFVLPFEG